MCSNRQKSHHRPFGNLSPDRVLAAAEQVGVETEGSLFALNSYENRVYQLMTESHGPLVLKFYRPDRWSNEQILEEHAFSAELVAADVPVSAPLAFDGRTLLLQGDLRFAVFRKESARRLEVETEGALELIGRTMGRLHAVGSRRVFRHRPVLSIERLGWQAREALLRAAHDGILAVDPVIMEKYSEVSAKLLNAVESVWARWQPLMTCRIHGDGHLGNFLWNDHGPLLVDLDDCMTGPRVQDLWMFLSGSESDREAQWEALLKGYRHFHEIDPAERNLIEALRALRMIHHAGWIAARWADPAFPKAFPWFATARHWGEHVSDLWQQLEAL